MTKSMEISFNKDLLLYELYSLYLQISDSKEE